MQIHRSAILAVLAVLLLAMSILGCGSAPEVEVDQSTPEVVVRTFLQAGNENDVDLLWAIMDHEDPSNKKALQEARKIKAAGLVFWVENVKLTIVENDGQTARIMAVFDETIKLHDEVLATGETGSEFTCVKRDGKWYLVGVGEWPPPGWVIER